MKLELLSHPEMVVFTTREYATRGDVAMSTASRQLRRAAERGALVRVARGIWANATHPHFHPLACVSRILGNEEGYVSFLTSLRAWGAIEQIPRAMHVATTGHARTLKTPVGMFELFQLAPSMMLRGVAWSDTTLPYRLASAEKALVDTLYISIRRGRRFRSLPELNLTKVRRRGVLRHIRDIEDPRTVSAVERAFDRIWID